MTEWDVDDRNDFRDFQDDARSEARSEARREARLDEWLGKALRCGECDFRWPPGWESKTPYIMKKLSENPGACPVCGSMRKAPRE